MRNAVIQFSLRFLVNQQKVYIQILVFHLGWYQLGVNLFKSTKPPSGIQRSENSILSLYGYKSFNKFIVHLFASEMWFVLFKEYTAISLLFALRQLIQHQLLSGAFPWHHFCQTEWILYDQNLCIRIKSTTLPFFFWPIYTETGHSSLFKSLISLLG